jgi:hypothetical protein
LGGVHAEHAAFGLHAGDRGDAYGRPGGASRYACGEQSAEPGAGNRRRGQRGRCGRYRTPARARCRCIMSGCSMAPA